MLVVLSFALYIPFAAAQVLMNDRIKMWNSGKDDDSATHLSLDVPRKEVNFIAIGDWGEPGFKFDRMHMGLVDETRKLEESGSPPDFMVLLGDNFYPVGVVSSSDSHWDEHWYGGILKGMDAMIPWYTILGNHDHVGNHGQAQVNFHYSSRNDGRWQLPDFFYSQLTSFRGGSLCNVFVDVMKLGHKDQLSWMEGVLASEDCQKASWIIVYNHYPLVSAGKNRYNSKQPVIRKHVLPLLQKYGVDLFLSGHDHDLQHLKYPGGPHVVVSGAGSQPRHNVGALIPERVSYLQEVVGFVSVKASNEEIRVEYVANNYMEKNPKSTVRPEMGFSLGAADRSRKMM